MKKIILTIFSAVYLFACTSSNDFNNGKNQLENMGYTDVVKTGYSFFCCGKDDSYSTGFTAKNKKGETVRGCMCSAIGKGITIRFE